LDKCIFCQIAAREIPADIVYQDDRLIAFKDIKPLAPVHLLIIPRKHLESLNSIGEDDTNLLGAIQQLAVKLARDAGVAESGYRLFTNCGPDAGQVVKHLHYHLLGGGSLGPGN